MSKDLTKRTNDEQITVDRLNAEIERLKELAESWKGAHSVASVDRDLAQTEIHRLNTVIGILEAAAMNETYIAHYKGHVIKLVRHGEIWKSFVKGKEWGGESADRHRCLENAKEAIDEACNGETQQPKAEWVINGIKVTVERDPAASDELTTSCYVFRLDGLRAKVLFGFEALEKMVWLNKLEREQ